MTTLTPNPTSPYATANPQFRHLFAVPVFFPAPTPGALLPTACEAMAVVGDEVTETQPGAELPDGLCPLCVAVMNGGQAPARQASECGECGTGTWHGALCALCRQEKHEAWWPTRGRALSADRLQEIRDSIPTTYGPPWTVHPDMDDDVWRVKYATDHPLAGLVCEVPDYGAHLAEFIATARAAVPELLAEIDRLRSTLEQIRHLHKDSPMGPCPVCINADAAAAGGDGTVPYPCPTARLAGAQDCDPPSAGEVCGKCRQPFGPSEIFLNGRARYGDTPFCRSCVNRCHDNEIADHRCVICA
ncbi:hypothetical protein [Streptomyces sp. NPDC091215]|uniref:hypothetical protein n=1 Tax=Streptomyces sp. NPDC091215 TaxID=3155192 RepID=UPI00343F913C